MKISHKAREIETTAIVIIDPLEAQFREPCGDWDSLSLSLILFNICHVRPNNSTQAIIHQHQAVRYQVYWL